MKAKTKTSKQTTTKRPRKTAEQKRSEELNSPEAVALRLGNGGLVKDAHEIREQDGVS